MPATELIAPASLIAALAKVMGEVGAVKKEGTNDFHRYKYATASDVFFGLQPLLAKHGVVIFQDEAHREFVADGNAIAVTYEFTIAHSSGEVWPHKQRHTGIAAARTSKGSFDDKSVNKCHTAARKYFVLALFQIPTGDYPDPDADGEVPNTDKSRPQQTQQRQSSEKATEREPSPGEKGGKAAMLYAISLAETEADLNDWLKADKHQEALETLAPQAKDEVRRAWAAKRNELRASAQGHQEAA